MKPSTSAMFRTLAPRPFRIFQTSRQSFTEKYRHYTFLSRVLVAPHHLCTTDYSLKHRGLVDVYYSFKHYTRNYNTYIKQSSIHVDTYMKLRPDRGMSFSDNMRMRTPSSIDAEPVAPDHHITKQCRYKYVI